MSGKMNMSTKTNTKKKKNDITVLWFVGKFIIFYYYKKNWTPFRIRFSDITRKPIERAYDKVFHNLDWSLSISYLIT